MLLAIVSGKKSTLGFRTLLLGSIMQPVYVEQELQMEWWLYSEEEVKMELHLMILGD